MKSITLACLLTALLAPGCMPQLLQPDPVLTQAFHGSETPTPVVTADEVNEKNAAEVGRRLNEEIQKDEQSCRGGAMERSKLAIP